MKACRRTPWRYQRSWYQGTSWPLTLICSQVLTVEKWSLYSSSLCLQRMTSIPKFASGLWALLFFSYIVEKTLLPRLLMVQIPLVQVSETLAWRGLPRYRIPNSLVASIILPAPNQSPNKKKVDSPLRISHLINEKASGLSLSSLRQSQESLFDSFTSQNDPISINLIRAQATHRDPDKEKNLKISPKAKTLASQFPKSFTLRKTELIPRYFCLMMIVRRTRPQKCTTKTLYFIQTCFWQ